MGNLSIRLSKKLATTVGFGAVLLWALLAFLTVGSDPVPPFLLNALCFAIGGLVGLVWTMASGGLGQLRKVPLKVYAFGTLGLFGYHFLYFSALRLAPAAEASLIAYLWPLLIVLLSGLLPGERLSLLHIIGGLLGFAGAGLIVASGGHGFSSEYMAGYGLAFLCAFTWSSYSVVSRRFGAVPAASVTVFCIATAILSVPAHLIWETTVWPVGLIGWGAVIGLGLGPVGLAFFVWDVGVKRGDIQLLGVTSYAAPVLSTFVLVLAGMAQFTVYLAGATVLITLGALLASYAGARK